MIALAIVLVVLVAVYFYNVRNFNYWKIRGVKYEKPIVFFGTAKDIYLLKKSVTQFLVEVYFKYPTEKIIGTFRSSSPVLVVRDPELIKRILITDFNYFHQRGILPGKNIEPLLRNLFFGEGDLWRLLRQRITPAFTSGKLKAMFPLITERAEQLQVRTLKSIHGGHSIDARDLMARYTTDFIGACAFGLDAGSLNDENSPFRKLGVDIFKFSYQQIITLLLKDWFPDMTKNLKFLGRLEKDIFGLVNVIQKQRNYQPSDRNDFIDLLLECRKKGTMKGESIEHFNEDGTPQEANIELDDIIMAAQVLVFFAAGFETSSSATSFTLHKLAYHPEVQKKVQKEIDNILSQNDGKLSYDAIKEMKYLEWVFKESMRIFPSLGFLVRKCTKEYTFSDINVSIDAGVEIYIPVQALHYDPEYWRNPKEFRPERFDPDEFKGVTKSVYLPFGDGPRSCIGERLGLMQSLAGLAAILSRFKVEPAPESKEHPSLEIKPDLVQNIDGGLPLIFRERKCALMANILPLLLVVFQFRAAFSILNQITKTHANALPILVQNHQHHKISPISTVVHPHHIQLLSTKSAPRRSKGINLPIGLPITHQLLVPTNLHVIPIHSKIHGSVHADISHVVTKENMKLPLISQTFTHSATNITHSLIPFLIPLPYHNHFVPVQDLTVIPLHSPVQNDHKLSQFRTTMTKKDNDDEEPMNQYRSFYGGYGTGLFFGGHGAGHGFYAGYG